MLDEIQFRIKSRVSVGSKGCWNWNGYIDRDGYGRFSVNGKQDTVHRISFAAFGGIIPQGLQLDHLCRNRRCCNPKHLEPVTKKENTLRGTSFSAVNARKTHCDHGHAFDDRNTYRHGGRRRQCRKCNARAVQRYNMRSIQNTSLNSFANAIELFQEGDGE